MTAVFPQRQQGQTLLERKVSSIGFATWGRVNTLQRDIPVLFQWQVVALGIRDSGQQIGFHHLYHAQCIRRIGHRLNRSIGQVHVMGSVR